MPHVNIEDRRVYSRQYQRKRYHENPEAARVAKRARRKSRQEQFATRPCPLHCECCGRSASEQAHKTVLSFDHDHVTGQFRGWLCNTCNRGIGLLGDRVESVEQVLAYLKRSQH